MRKTPHKVMVIKDGKRRNIPPANLTAFEKRGYVKATADAPAPVEAKKTKVKKEAENVDTEE